MLQVAISDGVMLDPFPFQKDDAAASEVDVSRGEIVEPSCNGSDFPADFW